MASNFQHMGGVGQMMPQQQQRQQSQRPSLTSGNIQQLIYQTLTAQTGQLGGWRANVLIQERMGLVFNLIGNLRLASAPGSNPPNMTRMIEIGIKFEKDIFEKSPDKETYKAEMQQKLDQLLARRAEHSQALQQTINQQAHQQAHAQAQAVQNQQMLMNQNVMQGQGPRNIPQQSVPQGFQHLQHQMQPSPLPGQQAQPSQMHMGMQSDGMPPNMNPNSQQFLAMQHAQQQPQQSQNVPGRPQNGQAQMSQPDMNFVMELANKMMNQASDQEKNSLRNTILSKMDPAQLSRFRQTNTDPVIHFYRNQALNRFKMDRQRGMNQAQSQLGMSQQQSSQNISATAPPMQQQRSMNPSPLPGHSQPSTTMGGNADMGSFLIDQQQQGLMAEEAGQMVVPVSGAQRNPTPQPGVMPGQQLSVNDQRPGPNPNARAIQQQQMFNAQQQAQQAQTQRTQFQPQQHSQPTARSTAQQKALQGQPGGMGNGPMPPQQSPGMGTLNTPLRPPAHQSNQPDMSQPNVNAQFGQPIDPRMQNPRQFNNPALTAMFSAMPPEQRQRLQGLPPDKLNEMANKWHQSRMAAQAGGSQGNPQMGPGPQVPPQGQFLQNPANQFTMANPIQRPPPGMTQQQVLQQQMRLQQQNPLQQRTGPGGPLSHEQRIYMQMDGVDYPATLRNQPTMPRGIPTDVTKWGALKQWAQNNPNVTPGTLETIKNYQKTHFNQIIQRSKAGIQPGGQPLVQNGSQGGPGGMPMVPPGMSAPVAPMQNPMQLGNGIPPQVTPQDIQTARNHPSGRMAQLTDDQLRLFLMRQYAQANQQQQQQQRNAQLLQMQMANNQGQQRRANPQGQAPPMTTPQMQQPKQTQPESAPTNTSTTNNARTTRPATSGRIAAQASSPAQPQKNNLKRASSDDVVEVPNPNIQQSSRSVPQAPQVSQGQQPTSQQPRQLTPQQIASLDPNARKAYEQSVQAWKAQRMTPQDLEDMNKLKTFSHEEARQSLTDIPMDAETRANMIARLRDILPALSNVFKVLTKWFAVTHDENRARLFFRFRHRLSKQFKDAAMSQPKDVFSIRPAEVEQARNMLSSMVKDLSDRFPSMKKDPSAQGNSNPLAQPQVPAILPPASSVPLSAANLQQQQQQLGKVPQRSNSRNSQTPAAPTSAQPPFQFGFGVSSPQGTPAYNSKLPPAVTQESLHIPARKKQKPNNGQQTPGSNASPQVQKISSPEVKRQSAPEPKPQPKPALSCPEPDCDRHNSGFDTEEALRQHTQREHIQPLENPLKYATESLGSLLGIDSQGRPKNPASTDSTDGPKMERINSIQGQTLNNKSELAAAGAASNVNPQVSTITSGAKAGVTSNPKSQSDSAKDTLARLQAGQRDPSKLGVVEGQEMAIDPWADATIDPQDLFQNFQGFESGAGGAISDVNVYRSLTPNDTPESSKDGVSGPHSDISDGVGLDINLEIFDDTWQPFGPSDIDLMNMDMDLSGFDGKGGDDLLTFEDDEPTLNYQTWDDVEQIDFNKPFNFDTSMYSMNAD